MAIKVQILTCCKACDGQAYLPVGPAMNSKGEPYIRYAPCQQCEGSGEAPRWVSLTDFLDLLECAELDEALVPNYAELAQHQPVTQYADSCESAGI